MKKLFVFDLDGTLVDSLADLGNAVNASLASIGKEAVELEYVKNSIGNGARKLIERCMIDATEKETEKAFRFFLPYYAEHCTIETKLYPGVKTLLKALHSRGYLLAVLTNKPLEPTQKILEDLGISDYFKHTLGGDSFPEKKPSPIGLQTLCEKEELHPDELLMIGDGTPDILAAKNAQVEVAALLNGIGQREDLLELSPDFQSESFAELAELPLFKSHLT